MKARTAKGAVHLKKVGESTQCNQKLDPPKSNSVEQNKTGIIKAKTVGSYNASGVHFVVDLVLYCLKGLLYGVWQGGGERYRLWVDRTCGFSSRKLHRNKLPGSWPVKLKRIIVCTMCSVLTMLCHICSCTISICTVMILLLAAP